MSSTELMLGFNEILSALVNCDTSSSVLVRGQPGIGKTALAGLVATKRAELSGVPHDFHVLDCTTADVGDVVIPNFAQVRGITQVQYAPNAVFGVGSENPVVILLDEIGKAAKPVQDALLPLLLEHRVGAYKLPKGSQVIATTNLVTDGVGDTIQAHAYNRLTCLTMRSPTMDEWRTWAFGAGVDATIIAAAQQFPMFFDMYTTAHDAKNNPYIFDPIHHPNRMQFTSPRSLEKAGKWLGRRHNMTTNGLMAALIGTIGEAAARDVITLVTLADQLPRPEDVIAEPKKTPIPEQAVAQLLLGLNVLRLGTPKTVTNIIEFLMRLRSEVQAVMVDTMLQGETNVRMYMVAPNLKTLVKDHAKYSQVFG